jgi:hypothetical protein
VFLTKSLFGRRWAVRCQNLIAARDQQVRGGDRSISSLLPLDCYVWRALFVDLAFGRMVE